jgi:hypothetical protein
MAITIFSEIPGSVSTKDVPDGTGDELEVSYRAFSDYAPSDFTEAAQEVRLTELATYLGVGVDRPPDFRAGLPLRTISTKELPARGWFEVQCSYEYPNTNEQQEGDTSFSFEISGESQKIRMSEKLLDIKGVAPGTIGKPCPIGWDGKKVAGIEIVVPRASWEETYAFANVTPTNRITWMGLVGKTNNAPFKGAATGEVLLESITGSSSPGKPWVVSFKFLYSQNRSDVAFEIFDNDTRSTVTFTSVPGWGVFDFVYHEQIEGEDIVIWPKAVLLHQVYLSGNFAALGIGV